MQARVNPDPRHDDAATCLQIALSRSVALMDSYDKLVAQAALSIRPTLVSLRALHAKHITQLSAMITAKGRDPDRSKGVMAAVKNIVTRVRVMLDGVTQDVLPAILQGERDVLDALATAELAVREERDRAELAQMRQELQNLLDDTPDQG